MKKIVIFLIIFGANPVYSADFLVFPELSQIVTRFKDSNKIQLISGAISSILVHEASHIAMLEINGTDYNLSWRGMSGHGERDYQSDMAGFVGQNVVGFILPRKSDFALGYNATTFLTTVTYPLRIENGDFGRNGRMLEWSLASLAASVNILRVEW